MTSVRLAYRRMRRAPGFAMTAIAILAVGIAVNIVIFTIMSAVLLRPLPFDHPDRLVRIGEAHPGAVGDGLVSLPVYVAWRARQDAIAVAAYIETDGILTGSEPLQVKMAPVSANFIHLLGGRLAIGRGFVPSDDRVGAPAAIILRYSLWQSRFTSDSTIIGRSVTIDGTSYQVAGVAAPGFDFPQGTDVWTSLSSSTPPDYLRVPTFKFLNVIGRLGPGASVPRASSLLGAIAGAVPHNAGWSARVTPLREWITNDVRVPLTVLMASVALVLLIACANVGNLFLVRGSARTHELAIRSALGASAARLARELFAEGALIATVAGALGLLLTLGSLGLVVRLAPSAFPRMNEVAIDTDVLLFTLGTVLFTSIATGLLPLFWAMRARLAPALRDGGHATFGRTTHRVRSSLVVSEVALSLVLLAGAGLLIRSFLALESVDPGFRTEHIATFQIKPPFYKYRWPAWHDFFQRLTTRIAAVPGVASVGTAATVPLATEHATAPIVVEGGDARATNAPALIVAVSPGYFQTMGIRLLAGRDFDEQDAGGHVAVAIASRTFARTFFPGQPSIGRKVRPFFGGPTMREIIGVVDDVHETSLARSTEPILYTLAAQQGSGPLTVVVRSTLPADVLAARVRAILHDIDPDQPIASMATMDALRSQSLSRPRSYAIALGAFALIAVALAAIGLYAIMAEFLAQHRRELAIRLALGADRRDIVRLMLLRGMTLVSIGGVLGIIAARVATRLMASLLFGIGPTDPTTFAGAFVVVVGVSVLAVAANAWRAARTTPTLALRI